MQIEKKVAVVTGAASGLGAACAQGLINKGARVAIFDTNIESGQALAANMGAMAMFCCTDVVDPASVQEALDKVAGHFGNVSVLINCAGIAPAEKVYGKKGPMNIDGFSRAVAINLTGTINVIRLSVHQMLTNEKNTDGECGVIINTASIAAFEGQVGQAAYSASKAGVVGLTLPLAREFAGQGIRVMTVAPGLFETPMLAGLGPAVNEALARTVPMPQRLGRAAEFAALAIHIIENAMLNGETIRLDGALRMGAR